MSTDPHTFLTELFNTTMTAGRPCQVLVDHLPEDRSGRVIVIGVGKAAGTMARMMKKHRQDEIQGLAMTSYRYGTQCSHIEVVEASHPVPDDAGERVVRRALGLISGLNESDRVIFLLFGGGSALPSLLVEGIGLADKQAMNKALPKFGVAIGEMNCVRKHLSAVEGSRLTKAYWSASIYTCVISDVLGDEATMITSDPNVGDPTTSADVLTILRYYAIGVPQNVLNWFAGPCSKTVKPGDPRLARGHFQLIVAPQNALDVAAVKRRVAGFSTLILGDLKGEAQEVAKVHTDITQQIRKHGQPLAAPCVIFSGGEITVTVRGNGRDGHNAEFLLSLIARLKGGPSIWAPAGDTGGVGDLEDSAGMLMTPYSHAHGEKAGLKVRDELDDNNGYGYFQTLGDLLVIGPTYINVNNFRTILILES